MLKINKKKHRKYGGIKCISIAVIFCILALFQVVFTKEFHSPVFNKNIFQAGETKKQLGSKTEFKTKVKPELALQSDFPKEPTTDLNSILTQQEQQMIILINQERQKVGLKPLAVDKRLVYLARLKSQDMVDKNYFDHQSPTYGSPFDLIKSAGVTYLWAGENIAAASTIDSAHDALNQ